MKNAVLVALAEKWARESKKPEVEDGSPAAAVTNAFGDGRRKGIASCLADLRNLMQILGDESGEK